MTPRTAIARIARAIGEELECGPGPSEGAWAAGEMLAETGATAEIAACLLAEARRKHPNDRLIHGCAFLLERALDVLRLRANGGNTDAGRAIAAVRADIAAALAKQGAAPGTLMLLARAFAQAELDPGEALQQAVLNAVEARSGAMPPEPEQTNPGNELEAIAAALGDPFAIYAELAATGAAFPPEHRAAMAAALAMSDNAAVREAALGFACAADRATSAAALHALARPPPGHPVPSRLVERLVRLRPWLAEGRRAELDAAVRALRPTVMPPAPAPRPEIRRILSTLCDGAGAQSLFGLARQGRRFALAAVLVKTGAGITDAWVAEGLSRTEAEAMIGQMTAAGIETTEIPIALLERRLADALAANLARDVPPPFGLLQVAETLGLGPLHPEAVPPLVLATDLLAGLPAERTDAAAALAAHRASAGWEQDFSVLESWFEAGEEVEALLHPLRTRKQRIEAVLTQLLPERRGFWAERCAWMAAVLRESAEAENDACVDFALVARDLAGERPLDTMPLAARIAAATVQAFQQH